jgi:hypothetical protein
MIYFVRNKRVALGFAEERKEIEDAILRKGGLSKSLNFYF